MDNYTLTLTAEQIENLIEYLEGSSDERCIDLTETILRQVEDQDQD